MFSLKFSFIQASIGLLWLLFAWKQKSRTVDLLAVLCFPAKPCFHMFQAMNSLFGLGQVTPEEKNTGRMNTPVQSDSVMATGTAMRARAKALLTIYLRIKNPRLARVLVAGRVPGIQLSPGGNLDPKQKVGHDIKCPMRRRKVTSLLRAVGITCLSEIMEKKLNNHFQHWILCAQTVQRLV